MDAIIIAIDGHSSCGKSTLAKDLAKNLGYGYVDTGAMYRAVTLYFLRHNVDIDHREAVKKALDQINLRFEATPEGNHIFLNGTDVEADIRQMYVSNHVSPVATIPEVRRAMVRQQQDMGKKKGIVMDGRDIGTVVFPQAELKIFLTASIEERARRRFEELVGKGIADNWESVRKNLLERDHIDSTRADSPLRQAEDAVRIDNTHLNRREQLEMVLQLARDRMAMASAVSDEQSSAP